MRQLNEKDMMVTKDNLIRAIYTFIDNDMLPKASGNYKVILNLAKVAINYRADSIFNVIKNNSFVSMLGVIDERDLIDLDSLVRILTEGLGSDEFEFNFKVLTGDYKMCFTGADIHKIASYV